MRSSCASVKRLYMSEKSLLVAVQCHVDKHQKEFLLGILERLMKVKMHCFILFPGWQAAMQTLEDLLDSLI